MLTDHLLESFDRVSNVIFVRNPGGLLGPAKFRLSGGNKFEYCNRVLSRRIGLA